MSVRVDATALTTFLANVVGALDDGLQDAIEQAEIEPEIAIHATRDRYNLMIRQQVPNLLDDPNARWREYR